MWKSDWGWVITSSSHAHSCVHTDANTHTHMHMTHTRRKKNITIGRNKIIRNMIKELVLNWQLSQEVNPERSWLWWLASCQLDPNEIQLMRWNLDWKTELQATVRGTEMGNHYGQNYLWDGGPELYKKADWVRQEKQASKQLSSMASTSSLGFPKLWKVTSKYRLE